MKQIHHNRKAQAVSLVIVLTVIALLGGAAYMLSDKMGSEISGMASHTYSDGCGGNISGPGYWTIESSTTFEDCPDFGIKINASNVVLDCEGKTIDGDGSGFSKGLFAYNETRARISNITIKNCVVSDFYDCIKIGADFGGHARAVNSLILNNSISSCTRGIFARANDSRIINNSADASEAAILTHSDRINISGNSLTGGDYDLFLSSISDNNLIWLNNFKNAGIDNEGSSNTFCLQLSNGTIRDYFGNYYATDDTSKWGMGCSGGGDYNSILPSEYTGTLPLKCGAEVLDDLTLSEDLKNSTGGSVCPGTGLSIESDNVILDCGGQSIDGGNNSFHGIIVSKQDFVTVRNCVVKNFSRGINLGGLNNNDFATNCEIYDNEIYYCNNYGSSAGIRLGNGAKYNNISRNIIKYNNMGIDIKGSSDQNSRYNTIKYNILDNRINDLEDMDFNNMSQDNYIYGNQMFQGIGNIGIDNIFCVNSIGNNYTLNNTNLPESYDCGYAWLNVTDYCDTNLTVKNTYLLNNVSCSSDGLKIEHDDMLLDCRNNSINHTVNGDQAIVLLANRSKVHWCNISNFDDAISIRDNSMYHTIKNNIFDDLQFNIKFYPGANYSNISNNNFLSGGFVFGSTQNNFCVNNVGNFYEISIPPEERGPNDCGAPDFNESDADGQIWTDSTPATFIWKPQDSALPVTYDLYIRNLDDLDTPGWRSIGSAYTESFDFDPDPYWNGSYAINNSFQVNITPRVLETVFTNESLSSAFNLSRDTDADGDGWTALSGDCNDVLDYINPDAPERCDIGNCDIDYNCDGQSRWGDPECDATKNGLTFNPDSFTNDFDCSPEFADIESVPSLILNHSSDLLKIHFHEDVDLNGTDLRLIDVATGFLDVDEQLVGLTNRTATLEFRDLPFEKDPVIFRNGQVCPPSFCYNQDYKNNIFNVTVLDFSTYNLTNSSRLHIYDQNDSEVGEISEVYHRISFYANYTRTFDNVSINDRTGGAPDQTHAGYCNFTLYHWNNSELFNDRMEYLPVEGVYKIVADAEYFDSIGTYTYDIKCHSTLYETATASDSITILDDNTPPVEPTLYPQILLHPSNYTGSTETTVAGYFGEPDIDASIVVLQGTSSYEFNTTTEYSSLDSEYKGDAPIVNFKSLAGENVTFTEWSQDLEKVFLTYDYVEFSSHNRSLFKRYHIVKANRTGNDIRLEFEEPLEQDVPIGTTIYLYTTEYPAGYFVKNVTLFDSGTNRITVWGEDLSENTGSAAEDWINAPYPPDAPPAPVFWSPAEAVNDTFWLYGYLNDPGVENINLSLVIAQYPFINETTFPTRWFNLTGDENYTNFYNYSVLNLTRHPSESRNNGTDFIFISDSDYALFSNESWCSLWLEFSNHDLDYWKKYEIYDTKNLAGEDARLYISPNLQQDIDTSVLLSFYNSSRRHGSFNITSVNTSIGLQEGMNTIYAVGFRDNTIEGLPSEYQYIYYDLLTPQFNFSSIPEDYYSNRTPTIRFRVSDNHKPDPSTILLNISDGGSYNVQYNSSNFTCNNITSNHSIYECFINLNYTEAGEYNATFFTKDLAGNINQSSRNITLNVTQIDITGVNDLDDITNDVWMYFNWTSTSGELDYYDFALGTAAYPDPDFNSIKDWNSTEEVFGEYNRDWVNFTHNYTGPWNATQLKMKTGTVYYLTVRAKNKAGEYGQYASSDGILFIDLTPPAFRYIDDHGPWTNDNTQLRADWLFEDNESDIIEYMYAVGTAQYPDQGWDSVVSPTMVDQDSVVDFPLSLVENETYYYNVKARNGNTEMNYSGSWSAWQSSGGVQVDTYPPSGGRIEWLNRTYVTTGYTSVFTDPGYDLPGTSDNVKGLIQIGSAPMNYDLCPGISDFDWLNSSDMITGPTYRDVNVSSGYCYVFRLYAWDDASNGVTYHMPNETLRFLKVDQTSPTDVAPVVDDGFYTNDRTSLHAQWSSSSDPESGFDLYYWRILEQPLTPNPACVINISDPSQTTCMPIAAGTSTSDEISINNLNMTHNYKYYFEVKAKNNAGLNSTERYSDGIIYIDNAPPDDVQIASINGVNHSSSPYFINDKTYEINITAIGDLDGYNDIADCVLLPYNIDYTEDYPADECTIDPHEYVNSTHTDVTLIECSNHTDKDTEYTQGTWSWYLSCIDHYGNSQSFGDNTHVWFTVDWNESPEVEVELSMTENDTLSPVTCNAWISDNESDFDPNNVTFYWYRDGVLLYDETTFATDGNSDGVYEQSVQLSSDYTARGNGINCTVSAYDLTGLEGINSSEIMIGNYGPHSLSMLDPVVENLAIKTYKDNVTFSWYGPVDDDLDFQTFTLIVDNESVSGDLVFNVSDNPDLSYSSPVKIPGAKKYSPSVYQDRIVYLDNRSGDPDWDIYMYNTVSGVETPVAISSEKHINPKIWGDYVVFEVLDSSGTYSYIKKYEISSGLTTNVYTQAVVGSMDSFGNRLVWKDQSDGTILVHDLETDQTITFPALADSSNFSVYGDRIAFDNSTHVFVYDTKNRNLLFNPAGTNPDLFGDHVVYDNSTHVLVYDLYDEVHLFDNGLDAQDYSLYGSLLAYTTTTQTRIVDLLKRPDKTDSLSIASDSSDALAIYDDLVVYENSSELYFVRQERELPAYWIIEDSGNAVYTQLLDNTEDQGFAYMLKACDSALAENSCTHAVDSYTFEDYSYFNVDRTPPDISTLSPTNGSVVAGVFKIFAVIDNNIYPYDSTVTSASYNVKYRDNGSSLYSGSMSRSGNTWNSTELDFTFIDEADFTLEVWANDTVNNTAYRNINFTVNNASPWFSFGSGAYEIIDGVTAFKEDLLRTNFTAYTVYQSTLEIIGPLPSTTQRFIETKVNTTTTNHDYFDDISMATWPDGEYKVIFTGKNLGDFSTGENRTFFLDTTSPEYSDPSPAFVYWDESLTLSINWTDLALEEVNITYDNPDSSDPTPVTETFSQPLGLFESSPLDVSDYINKTFTWNSTARDAVGLSNSSSDYETFEVFVSSRPPYLENPIPVQEAEEDTSIIINLSDYFTDPDVLVDEDIDNLTFEYNDSNASHFTADITGSTANLTPDADWSGVENITFRAIDYYGNQSSWTPPVILNINPVNDAPIIKNATDDPIPDITRAEDSGLYRLNLSEYAYDVDDDMADLTWSLSKLYNKSLISAEIDSSDPSSVYLNITPKDNMTGTTTLNISLYDDESASTSQSVLVNITPVNDAPTEPSITNSTTGGSTPSLGSTVNQEFRITWTNSFDIDGDSLNYTLEYNNGTGWYIIATDITDNYYDWSSQLDITDTQSIDLRVNVTDGTVNISSDTYGSFTVDNDAPDITVLHPTIPYLILPGTINLTTDESATCTYVFNVSGVSFNIDTDGFSHNISLSGLTADTSYRINATCEDGIGNPSTELIDFTAKSTGLEIISVSANPADLIIGNPVNLTLEIFSITPWDDLDLRINRSGTDIHVFDTADFTDEINSSNSLTYNLTSILTSNPGRHDVFITNLNNTNADTITNQHFTSVFTTYPEVNQTIYILT